MKKGYDKSMSNTDTMSNLRAAIAYSKKPGNEGMSLANSKGFYRPAREILEPVMKELEASEALVKSLEDIINANFGNQAPVIRSLQYALEEYRMKAEGSNDALNAAKRQMLRGSK